MTDHDDSSQTSERAVQVAQSFVAVADTLVDDFDVVAVLDRLVADCVRLLDISVAGILLLNQNRVLEVVASSDEASRLMEVFQLESHSGPCVEAVQTGEMVSVVEADGVRRRWPAFGTAAADVGFTAVYAFPMRLRNETIGALNLFTAERAPLSGFDLRLGQGLADIATIAILQQRTLTPSSELAEKLQLALDTRITVEQAKGVLAEFGGVDMGEAFEALRAAALEHNVKLSDVARSLVSRRLHPNRVIDERTPR
jgi:transcriptional regulator with GAF, ATPase, and Fis domain